MKSYDVAVFILAAAPVYAKLITADTAGKIFFCYVLARIAYSALFSKR